MQVILHAGAFRTDEDRLINCLYANRDLLADQGTEVPNPAGYRKLIRDLLHAALSGNLAADGRDQILDAVSHDASLDRLVFSNESFFGTPKMAASGGILYANAETRLGHFSRIFPDDRIELFLAICNPATFLPSVYDSAQYDSIDAFLGGTDPRTIRWSDTVTRMRQTVPNVPITLWCNEDTPLIWSQLLREMGGLDPTTPLDGEFALATEIMTAPGIQRFTNYMEKHPGMSEMQKRRVVAAFLDKFADESVVEEELDIPGWTDTLVDELTEIYDEDLFALQKIPGVNLITP